MPNGLPHKHPSVFKIIAACLGAFAFLIVLSAVFVPLFFSTALGKKMLVTMIGNQSGYQVEIDELSLSWTGKQWAKGVRVQKPKEQLMITCASAWLVPTPRRVIRPGPVPHIRTSSRSGRTPTPMFPS